MNTLTAKFHHNLNLMSLFPLVSNSLRHRTIDICLSVRLSLHVMAYSVPAISILKLYSSVVILVG